MSEMIRCSECDRTWSVESVEGSGEIFCPYCMTRIPPDEQATPAAQSAVVVPPQADPAEGVRPVATAQPARDQAPRPAAAVVPRPAPVYEVVCPRCNLHFQPRKPAAEREESRKTVLVVDDLEYFREIAKDALGPICRVETAASSVQAREILAQGGIDLLVLDLALEGTGEGHRFLSELGPKPCPILIYTAQDESELYGEKWEKLQNLGADDLVIKGMQVAESLARKASSLLGLPMDDEDAIG